MSRPLRLLVAGVLAAGVPLVALAAAGPAEARSRVTVTNDRGGAEADDTYQTRLTIRGTGFQPVRGGFGGVYAMFGWVDDPQGGSWKPSRGGLTGRDYRYIPDVEGSGNRGYLQFIAFPGGATAGEAQTVMSGSGGFTVRLTVPGPRFDSVDRTGATRTVDCTEVTCGVITIGAHGVKSPANETFTPVRFGDVYDEAPAGGDAPTPTGGETDPPGSATTPDGGAATPGGGRPAAGTGRPVLSTDRATAVAGRALTFVARGFSPGEQVVAILDDGVAVLGPVLAGTGGEVAGVIRLPADTSAGTHELRLTGAASGVEVSERFPVTVPPTAAAAVGEDDDAGLAPRRVFLLGAAAVFLLALAAAALRLVRARRAATPGAPDAPGAPA
ncbi:hypothetical protein [Nocardioides sp. SYSU D00038]|uniref:hypothetical protein n=1 Tax=Nocardioides sp. SYSU D00038 TaxID=2812554 RepID=UPI001966D6D9|nr:hypothetical protein [Nocardioides sp. SYSU D00038]